MYSRRILMTSDRKSTRLNSSHQLTLFPYTTLFRSSLTQRHWPPSFARLTIGVEIECILPVDVFQAHPNDFRSEEHTSELQSPIDTLSLHDALPIFAHSTALAAELCASYHWG